MTTSTINHSIPGTDDCRPNGNSSRNDVRQAIIAQMHKQMAWGKSKQYIISYATAVAKSTGFVLYIDAIYEAVKEGRI